MAHHFPLRVYYEDTDLAGIVYYANYLKFIERGRSEWVRGLGIDQGRLKAEAGIVFAVRRIVADYLSPARFDEVITVGTALKALTGARIVLDQTIARDGLRLFQAEVTLVCLDGEGRAGRIGADLRRRLAAPLP